MLRSFVERLSEEPTLVQEERRRRDEARALLPRVSAELPLSTTLTFLREVVAGASTATSIHFFDVLLTNCQHCKQRRNRQNHNNTFEFLRDPDDRHFCRSCVGSKSAEDVATFGGVETHCLISEWVGRCSDHCGSLLALLQVASGRRRTEPSCETMRRGGRSSLLFTRWKSRPANPPRSGTFP